MTAAGDEERQKLEKPDFLSTPNVGAKNRNYVRSDKHLHSSSLSQKLLRAVPFIDRERR